MLPAVLCAVGALHQFQRLDSLDHLVYGGCRRHDWSWGIYEVRFNLNNKLVGIAVSFLVEFCVMWLMSLVPVDPVLLLLYYSLFHLLLAC